MISCPKSLTQPQCSLSRGQSSTVGRRLNLVLLLMNCLEFQIHFMQAGSLWWHLHLACYSDNHRRYSYPLFTHYCPCCRIDDFSALLSFLWLHYGWWGQRRRPSYSSSCSNSSDCSSRRAHLFRRVCWEVMHWLGLAPTTQELLPWQILVILTTPTTSCFCFWFK